MSRRSTSRSWSRVTASPQGIPSTAPSACWMWARRCAAWPGRKSCRGMEWTSPSSCAPAERTPSGWWCPSCIPISAMGTPHWAGWCGGGIGNSSPSPASQRPMCYWTRTATPWKSITWSAAIRRSPKSWRKRQTPSKAMMKSWSMSIGWWISSERWWSVITTTPMSGGSPRSCLSWSTRSSARFHSRPRLGRYRWWKSSNNF